MLEVRNRDGDGRCLSDAISFVDFWKSYTIKKRSPIQLNGWRRGKGTLLTYQTYTSTYLFLHIISNLLRDTAFASQGLPKSLTFTSVRSWKVYLLDVGNKSEVRKLSKVTGRFWRYWRYQVKAFLQKLDEAYYMTRWVTRSEEYLHLASKET